MIRERTLGLTIPSCRSRPDLLACARVTAGGVEKRVDVCDISEIKSMGITGQKGDKNASKVPKCADNW